MTEKYTGQEMVENSKTISNENATKIPVIRETMTNLSEPQLNVKTLYEALFAVQGELNLIERKGTNPHFKSRFTGLPTVIAAVVPVLQKHRLIFTQQVETDESSIAVNTRIVHVDSGEHHDSGYVRMPSRSSSNPQDFGSALTYARRYALMVALGLSPEDDDAERQRVANQPVPEEAINKYKTLLDKMELEPENKEAALKMFNSQNYVRLLKAAKEKVKELEDSETIADDGHAQQFGD